MITGIDKSASLLEKMLDVSSVKHKVIASNIANVNTPGYKRMEVSFADQLEKAMKDTSSGKFNAVQPKIVVSKDMPIGNARSDGNTVNIDKEIATLMENAESYNIYSQLLAKKIELTKSAIESSKA